jgi:hypothetical protein
MLARSVVSISWVLSVLSLGACSKDAPAGGASSATATTSAPAASTAAPAVARSAPAPAASSAKPTWAGADRQSCEVEVFGVVKGAPKGKQVSLILSDQDCMADGARVVGRSGVSPEGKFFYEVFVKWGSDLTICAAVEPAPGKPSTLYGKAKGPFHAEATGEVMFSGIEIELTKGAPHAFPTKIEPPAGHK